MTAAADVSRETEERLRALQALVQKWTAKINLISRGSADQMWARHILDSVQVFGLAPETARIWVDLGSGGGFPGLVVAVLAAERNPGLQVVLVESDQRKAAFLRHAAGELGLKVAVRAERIEQTAPIEADVVSARALAGLDALCAYAARHLARGGIALFHKGANAAAEVAEAERNWHFRLTQVQSATDDSAVLLKLEDLSHV